MMDLKKTYFRFMLIMSATVAMLVSASVFAQDVQSFDSDQILDFTSASRSIPGAKHFRVMAHDGAEVVVTKIWLPANTDIPSHGKIKEGKAASLLVLSGDLQLAMGDTFDAALLKPAPVGSFIVLTPGNDKHFVRTGDTAVELLLIESFSGDFSPELKTQ